MGIASAGDKKAMTQLTDTQFEDVEGVLNGAQPPLPDIVNAFSDVDGAYGRLLKRVNTKPVLISKEVREFRLDEPIYIRRIEVYGENNEKITKGLAITVRKMDGSVVELKAIPSVRANNDGSKTNYTQYIVKGFVTRVTVNSKLAYRKLTINRVSVLGYTLAQLELVSKKLEKAVDTYYSIDAFVAEKRGAVSVAKESKASLDEEISELQTRYDEAEKEAKEAEQELEELRGQVKIVSDSLEKSAANLRISQEALAATENSSAQLKEEIVSSNKEIVRRREELQVLVNDRSLISDEYRDYVSEGKGQAKSYLWLLVIPLLVVAFCSWQLYQGAVRILQLDAAGVEQVLSMSLQRIPFAAAIAFVVAVCWKIMSLLIGRIMIIHGQRLALARLLVIAKDTVAASSVGLDIADDEKFREHMALKLQMLKGHLTSELGRDFEYIPTKRESKKVESEKVESESGNSL